ncbi:hypothetical protein [Halobacillus sp. Marseille-P3879]|uniref:hypothetical protein n=1 Tax=Halobacillus sp. Marseille-P3879 TaxID=2045014 RepID=UPI000C7D7219|nr:hypothetical protein [Halobacillus sp. Marseille-P3879]
MTNYKYSSQKTKLYFSIFKMCEVHRFSEVKKLSDYLIKLLTDKIVGTLTKDQKEIYNYVTQMEEDVAEEVTTEQDFLVRLKSDSPHERAARHFDMTFLELINKINRIDEEIARQLETKLDLVRWIDCTELVRSKVNINKNQKVFFLSLP